MAIASLTKEKLTEGHNIMSLKISLMCSTRHKQNVQDKQQERQQKLRGFRYRSHDVAFLRSLRSGVLREECV
ncbi:hypothetical protein VNO77_42932 [Canavalia gladiata]|uniref:Uncharacterized protein n=1 Tax=Canavalia gladiata TaxID=3824 RepID=A0AAN9JTW4_CANGL